MPPSINALIKGLEKEDPKVAEAFKAIAAQLEKINEELFPRIRQLEEDILNPPVSAPLEFRVTALPTSLYFQWGNVEGAFQYEVREGTNWDTASLVIRTSNISANILPVLAGQHDYLLKSINRGGVYSLDTSSYSLTINVPGLVDITYTIVDNNVLLYWTVPVSDFNIDYYKLLRNGSDFGISRGTFAVIFENVGGTFNYSIIAVDLAGNEGVPNSVTILVNQPPDFILEEELEAVLLWPTTESNTFPQDGKMLVVVFASQTWEDHFTDNSWDSIQDQIDAGYPIYAQPAEADGYFEYIFDFGAILDNVIITTSWVEEVISGDIDVLPEISYSTDNITYTTPVDGASLFATSTRWVKVRLKFTPDDDTSLSLISKFICSLSVKREMDGGTVDVEAADAAGTVVEFNKAFKDVESITLTPLSTVEQVAIYDFVDAPYPTEFKILLYDAAGVRVDGTVSWKARGVI